MITPPYAFGRYGSDVNMQRLADMRRQLDDTMQQFTSKMVSQTYSGLGGGVSKSLDLRARLSAIDGYQAAIDDVQLRYKLMDQSLGLIGDSANKQSSEMSDAFEPSSNGQTLAQNNAMTRLSQALAALNQNAGDRYLFAGRKSDVAPVASAEEIMNGAPGRAGLKALIAERMAADMGSPVTGRVVMPAPASGATAVALSEEAGSGPFGLKIAGVSGSLGGATIQQPPATPGALSVDFNGGALPSDGQSLTIRFTLPDGTSASIALTARATLNSASGANEFQIGATAAETAANFYDKLKSAVNTVAGTALPAASSMAAAQSFFAATPANPPARVSGSPPSSLIPGTAGNTVIWYQGDELADPRSGVTARVDDNTVVKVGALANEAPIVKALAAFGALAGQTLAASDPLSKQRYSELSGRAKGELAGAGTGGQSVTSIRTELGVNVAQALQAKDLNKATKDTFQSSLSGIENINEEEVLAQLLSLQNSLQASYQATATLSKLKLSDYL